MFGKGITLKTEVTNGDCPTCQAHTVFVSLYKNVYRCVSCGTDNEQKINGVISYMPITYSGQKTPILNLIEEDGKS
tara:strand:+ start:194 stop:421 length:228 start_codon:yes stop_codon:yes gene_type:complete